MRQALAEAAQNPALAAALALHREGKLAEAIHAYRTILETDARNPNAAFLCGMAAMQAGAFEAAGNLFAGAVRIDPERPDFHANLGLALAQSGDIEASTAPLMRAALLDPAAASIVFNLGQVLERASRRAAALVAFRASSRLQPDHVTSWIEYGAMARLERKPAIANLALLTALRLDEEAARAWFNLALLRADQSLHEDSELFFRRVLEIDPHHVEAIGNLGNHLRALKRRSEARSILEDGLSIHPLSARLWSGLSAVNFDDDRIAQAEDAARRAALIDPSLVDATANLAQSLHRAGATSEAVRRGIRARRIAPAEHRLRFNQATYLLGDGRLDEGWDDYDARLTDIPELLISRLPGPRWIAGAPPGRNLWVAAEQGLGDELLFATCFPDLEALLENKTLESVIIESDVRLHALIRRAFPRFDVAVRPLRQRLDEEHPTPVGGGRADCHIHAGSLPRLFRRQLSDFLQPESCLVADPDRVAQWRDYLRSRHAGPILGLTWRSMNRRDRGDVYYPPIDTLGPILEIPGVRYVCLQYDDPEPDLAEIESRFGIQVIRPEGLDTLNDLDGIAALLAASDGMVSAYTAALNLAGTLNVRAYTATYGYYWPTLGTGTLPWYPSVRIEMRTGAEGWEAPIDRLARRLRRDFTA